MKTLTVLFLFLGGAATAETPSAKRGLAEIERTLVKEPAYNGQPKYCLLILDKGLRAKVWMIEDGQRLFLDSNGNGDLTDDGGPIALGKEPEPSTVLGYAKDLITTPDGGRHTKFVMHKWEGNEKKFDYGLSMYLNGTRQVYSGWFDTFWADKQEGAPVVHLGGDFVPQALRDRSFIIGSEARRFDIAFINRGSQPGAQTYLGTESLPADIHPMLKVTWPTKAGFEPIQTVHPLPMRCCYWDFYTTDFAPPRNIVPGKAQVLVDIGPASKSIPITTYEFTVPVKPPVGERQETR